MLDTILVYFSSFAIPFSIMDAVIIIVFCFYAYEGFTLGLAQSLLDLEFHYIVHPPEVLFYRGTILMKFTSLPGGC
jgi:hypothetical protein